MRRVMAITVALFLLLTLSPSWPTGSGNVNFDAGPYTLNMYFSELPQPWWEGTWWDTDWKSRQKLTFDAKSLSESLIDFPVLVPLNNTKIDYTSTQDAGEDIRFVDSDDLTVLDYEIERWNESGTSIVWVKVPKIDGGSTTDHIWMYYNNSLAIDAQNPAGVWTNGYMGVWHLDEDPSGPSPQMDDSTSNGNHGTTSGMMTPAGSVEASIGKGLRLDGFDDLIRINDSASLDSTNDEGTLEMWLKWTNSSDGDHQILMSSSNRFTTGANDGYEWASRGNGDHFFNPWGGNDSNYNSGSNPFTDGVYHHVATTMRFSTKEVDIYIDTVPMTFTDANVSTMWSNLASPNDWLWGGNPDRSSRYFDGVFDEIRVSDVVRSTDWSTAQHMSMTDTFVEFGGEDKGYQYRKKITVIAGSDRIPAGHSVSIILDHATLVSQGKSQVGGEDIRISYWNASYWMELNRVLDPGSSWNSNSTTIWFSIQRNINAFAADGNHYLHYGNPSVMNPPADTSAGSGIKSVQSGVAVSSVNGAVTVPISQVSMSKSFLIFNARHNSERPVGSEIRGRIATPTSLEFFRVTNESSPVPITVQWYVVEYYSGVSVQRGEIPSQSSTSMNVGIAPVGNVSQAFVTWSKTPFDADVDWSSDDPIIGELTSTSNLQFRVYGANAGHTIWWQVIEFTDPKDIDVQRGLITSMTGISTSANATLTTPVDLNRTFVLAGFTTEGLGIDVGARMLRAQLMDPTTVMIDRSISGFQDNITEISWQAIELKDGSRVLAGSENFGPGVNQKVVPLAPQIDVNRSIALASVQPVSGQSMGRSRYNGDDIMGVGSVTMALSSTQLTMERDNGADEADIGWFVVEFGIEKPVSVCGPEETSSNVQVTVSVYHTKPDGTDPQEIVTSPIITIDSDASYPLTMNIGLGPWLNFTDSDPRVLRLGMDVIGVNGEGRFAIAYNYSAQRSHLDVPTSPSTKYYLSNTDTSGIMPNGKYLESAPGVGGATTLFDTVGQKTYWYTPMWTPISIAILSPTSNQHITGIYDVLYSASPSAIDVSFEYLDGMSWTAIGTDPDIDGTYSWDTCVIGDRTTTLRVTAKSVDNTTAEDSVSNIEIDCTPPSIQITKPKDYSQMAGVVPISYTVDSDAVMVELSYYDGGFHTFETDIPPDGEAIWDTRDLKFSGAFLRAIACDEVDLCSEAYVLGLSTPPDTIPGNEPPEIDGVPDIIVHYDYSYNFDLTPYIRDKDNSSEDLVVWTSDTAHIWTSPVNNLGLVMNYPESMLGMTVRVTIWVTDGIGTDYQVINITVSDDYPPEKIHLLPDVSFDEDETVLNVFFTNMDYYFLDIDGDNLYYTSGNNSVKIRINANKTVDMWAEPDWFGFEVITIRATDPTGALVEDVVIVLVNPVNDAPVIDSIPDIRIQAGRDNVLDIMEYVHDIDTPLDSLIISVDSEWVTTDGFNLTLMYPSSVSEDLIRITVSDGEYSSYVDVRVIVETEEDSWLWVLLVLAAVVILLMYWYYRSGKNEIFVGYLIREDGALLKEVYMTDKRTVPYGLIRQRTKAPGISKAEDLDFDEYKVAILHGKRLHLAVVSSSSLEKKTRAELQEAIKDLDHDDSEETASNLDGFENHFREIGGYSGRSGR